MGFNSDAIKIPRPHRQLRIARLGLIVMVTTMVWAGEPLARALIQPAGVPVALAGSTGQRPTLPAEAVSGGQIIILSSTRNQVTLNGQTARLGDRLGAATLTGISDSQLTMKISGRTSRVDLYVGVEKRVTTAAPNETPEAVRPGAAN